MTPYKKRLNPFIRRMAEDMQLRNLSPRTIDSYTYHVDKFCHHFGKPAEQLGPEEIRQYQLYLINEKKLLGVPLTKLSVAYVFSTRSLSANRGPSATSPLANDPRNFPLFSPTRKPHGYSNVWNIPNIERFY